MKYSDHLAITKDCPFCCLVLNNIIKKGENSYITYALAPYSKHHLLVIPNRHVENYEDLKEEEKKDIDNLLLYGIKSIKKLGHEGYSILLREGEVSGKTIKHLHYHIIPSVFIGSLLVNNIDRPILRNEEAELLLKEFSGLD